MHASAHLHARIFFAHVARNQEVIRTGTYLPRYVVRRVFSSGASFGNRRRVPDRGEGDEKKASGVRGRISGIREIITVYIECNLAINVCSVVLKLAFAAQGRAKRNARVFSAMFFSHTRVNLEKVYLKIQLGSVCRCRSEIYVVASFNSNIRH